MLVEVVVLVILQTLLVLEELEAEVLVVITELQELQVLPTWAVEVAVLVEVVVLRGLLVALAVQA
jgi:hypothetical protein